MRISFNDMIKILCYIVAISLISACSIFSPVKSPVMNQYVLKDTPHVKKHVKHDIVIAVAPITSASLYNHYEMAYTTSPYEIDYFTKSKWAELPANMLQNLLIKTLSDTHYFKGVIAMPTYEQFDYLLNAQLLELKQVFYGDRSHYQVKLKVDLIAMHRNQLIASKTFAKTVTAHENTARGGVIAANLAVREVLKQMDHFVLKTVRNR